jgi:hypothetical protein
VEVYLAERTGLRAEGNVLSGSAITGYKVKGIQGCTNRHTDEKTLQQAFLRAVEILRENEEKLQEKWGNFSEDQKLEKYYAAKLKESLNSNQEEFNGRKM